MKRKMKPSIKLNENCKKKKLTQQFQALEINQMQQRQQSEKRSFFKNYQSFV